MRDPLTLELHRLQPGHDGWTLLRRPGTRQAAQVDDGVPGPGDALVELDHGHLDGPSSAKAEERVDDVVEGAQVLLAERVVDARLSKMRRQPDLVPSTRCRGSAPNIGTPSSIARSRSSVDVV